MENIIIFTNTDIIELKDLGTFKINDNQVIEPINAGDDKNFIVTYDGIEINQLDKIVNSIDGRAVFILYHSSPEAEILSALEEKLQKKNISVSKKESDHTTDTYQCLKKISNNKCDKNKLAQVFEKLKKQIVTISSCIQLHKRLILEKLDGKCISESMLYSLKSESEDLKVAINKIPEDIKKKEKALLDYISDQVIKYGA